MRALAVIYLLLFSLCAKAQSVYKTPSGAKYHLVSCHMVKNVSDALTLEEAAKLGLEPCKICKPAGAPQTLLSTKAQGVNKSTAQCLGQTKAGNRCKHMTSIANGYCYQHQPK